MADVADVQSLITGVQTNLTSEVTRATTAEAALAPISNPTFTNKITTPAASVTGFTGATTPTRYVGGVSGAAPTTGAFQTGDYVIDATGSMWICTHGTVVPLAAALRSAGSAGTTSSRRQVEESVS